jgi:hypothetical protein
MAKFVMAKQRDGRPVWINVDQVRYVVSNADRTKVYFDDHDAIEIVDQPSVVVDYGRKGSRIAP